MAEVESLTQNFKNVSLGPGSYTCISKARDSDGELTYPLPTKCSSNSNWHAIDSSPRRKMPVRDQYSFTTNDPNVSTSVQSSSNNNFETSPFSEHSEYSPNSCSNNYGSEDWNSVDLDNSPTANSEQGEENLGSGLPELHPDELDNFFLCLESGASLPINDANCPMIPPANSSSGVSGHCVPPFETYEVYRPYRTSCSQIPMASNTLSFNNSNCNFIIPSIQRENLLNDLDYIKQQEPFVIQQSQPAVPKMVPEEPKKKKRGRPTTVRPPKTAPVPIRMNVVKDGCDQKIVAGRKKLFDLHLRERYAVDSEQRSYLHLWTEEMKSDCVRAFISVAVDDNKFEEINKVDKNGRSCCFIAVEGGDLTTLQVIISTTPDLSVQGCPKNLKILSRQFPQQNIPPNYRTSPLHLAVRSKDPRILDTLLKFIGKKLTQKKLQQQLLNAPDSMGVTPLEALQIEINETLDSAALIENMKKLILAGANPLAMFTSKRTLIVAATQLRSFATAEAILRFLLSFLQKRATVNEQLSNGDASFRLAKVLNMEFIIPEFRFGSQCTLLDLVQDRSMNYIADDLRKLGAVNYALPQDSTVLGLDFLFNQP